MHRACIILDRGHLGWVGFLRVQPHPAFCISSFMHEHQNIGAAVQMHPDIRAPEFIKMSILSFRKQDQINNQSLKHLKSKGEKIWIMEPRRTFTLAHLPLIYS